MLSKVEGPPPPLHPAVPDTFANDCEQQVKWRLSEFDHILSYFCPLIYIRAHEASGKIDRIPDHPS